MAKKLDYEYCKAAPMLEKQLTTDGINDYLRQGVATLICDNLESMVDSDITIITHASVTAKPFFEKRGYRVVKEQLVEREGIFLKNYIMELFCPGKNAFKSDFINFEIEKLS